MEKIRVRIKKDGTTEVSAEGVKGSNCKALTRPIEEALGKVTSDEETAEMHQEAEATQDNTQDAGNG